jgi:DNA polymerase-3 subunit delta'
MTNGTIKEMTIDLTNDLTNELIKPSDRIQLAESFGSRSILGQDLAKSNIERIWNSGRWHHAYLLTGPSGSGKTAMALAMAELINSISHLTQLKGSGVSSKSSWVLHPDIHVFFPVPSQVSIGEIRARLTSLSEQPYANVNFSHLSDATSGDKSKYKKAFYPLSYFEEAIRPKAYLTPNEGKKTVIILTRIETMRKEVVNAFLKLLEEPPENVLFLLTTDAVHSLTPTLVSRCQRIGLSSITPALISEKLISEHHLDPTTAQYLSHVCLGNYGMAIRFNSDQIKEQRAYVVDYLRAAYAVDAPNLVKITEHWVTHYHSEDMIQLLNVMEVFLRDIYLWMAARTNSTIINQDQLEVIVKFSEHLNKARITDMLEQIHQLKSTLIFNANMRISLIVLALRFSRLMRGMDPIISEQETWKHLPHVS